MRTWQEALDDGDLIQNYESYDAVNNLYRYTAKLPEIDRAYLGEKEYYQTTFSFSTYSLNFDPSIDSIQTPNTSKTPIPFGIWAIFGEDTAHPYFYISKEDGSYRLHKLKPFSEVTGSEFIDYYYSEDFVNNLEDYGELSFIIESSYDSEPRISFKLLGRTLTITSNMGESIVSQPYYITMLVKSNDLNYGSESFITSVSSKWIYCTFTSDEGGFVPSEGWYLSSSNVRIELSTPENSIFRPYSISIGETILKTNDNPESRSLVYDLTIPEIDTVYVGDTRQVHDVTIIASSNGTLNTNTGAKKYFQGDQCTLIAIPANGYGVYYLERITPNKTEIIQMIDNKNDTYSKTFEVTTNCSLRVKFLPNYQLKVGIHKDGVTCKQLDEYEQTTNRTDTLFTSEGQLQSGNFVEYDTIQNYTEISIAEIKTTNFIEII